MRQSNPILQYANKPTSRKAAIKAMCAQCFGCTKNHLEKGFKESIRDCSSSDCPLHPLRPYINEKVACRGQDFHDQPLSISAQGVGLKRAKTSS